MYILDMNTTAWLPITLSAFAINALVLYLVIKWAIKDVFNGHHQELCEQIKLQNQLKIYDLMRQGATADDVQEQIDIAFNKKSQPAKLSNNVEVS